MPDPEVEVIRSARRTRSAQASLVEGRVRVRVPAGLSPDEERQVVEQLVGRIRRKLEAGEVDLAARAAGLARRYRLPQPRQITWSDRQNMRWGSCTPTRGSIRISNRLAHVPPFVLDYVIVHELAHLTVPGHGPEFAALVNRYELAERARGYLMAMGGQGGSDSPRSHEWVGGDLMER